MTVSRRLLLVAILCLLPSLAAGLFTQFDLHGRRVAELGELAMRQAVFAGSNLNATVEAARQIGTAAGQLPAVQGAQPACATTLAALNARFPRYAFVAAYDAAGLLICASRPGLANAPGWLRDVNAVTQVGYVSREIVLSRPFLPIGIPLPTSDGTSRGRIVVALDLGWLAEHIQTVREALRQTLVPATLLVADARGQVIARHPDDAVVGGSMGGAGDPAGRMLEPALINLLSAAAAGLIHPNGAEGGDVLRAYIPPAAQGESLFVAVNLPLTTTTAEIDGVALRAALMAGSATVVALILAMAAGEAFIRRPTERLVAAARRWRVGDFSARAPANEERSEFGRLAGAFNEMAAALQQRQAERDQASHLLEARVAERTRELSESNNRLQVEVAEREKTEAALAQAQKLQAVGRLAGGIAHDFNNLLATILGNLELIERRIDAGETRLHGMIQRATGAVTRGAQLTGRLLAFSRRHRPSSAATDVNRLVGDLMTLAASTLGRRIRIDTQTAPDLWEAMIDANQVEAAILNLALNARDAMPDGGTLTIATANETLREERDGLAPGDYVRVEVADTGIGMTEDVMRQAFEPFFTTKGPTGSGLGLSQVYGVANQTGGGVRIRSVPGAGTTVALLLPRALVAAAGNGPAPTPQRLETPPRVLLIDDDRAVSIATVEMLRDLGCEVLDALSGEEGLDILQNEGSRIGALVVDYAMPGMTGLQVATLARRMGYQQPILMITGYAELGEGSETGIDALGGILHKPFTIRELEAALHRLMTAPVAVT